MPTPSAVQVFKVCGRGRISEVLTAHQISYESPILIKKAALVSPLNDLRAIVRVVTRTLTRRRARAAWTKYDEQRGPLPEQHFQAAIYFADSLVNIYQIRQWYEPMRQLALQHPVVVIARNVVTAETLRHECPVPIVLLPTVFEIEEWLETQSVATTFYVNQNTRNFQMMRFHRPAHTFISHGESDKVYMASNQLKAYDYTFIAGDAARQRIDNRLLNFNTDEKLVAIGRPQVDVTYPGPDLPEDERTVVLYAPTWEGDRPSMNYSSLATHAIPMLERLISSGQHRIIYRPHPRTGAFDKTYARLHKEIVKLLRNANRTDPGAEHMVDTDTPFGWHLASAHACVCDISAVAFDWLATGKPLLLTEPSLPGAEVDRTGLVGMMETLTVNDVEKIESIISDNSRLEQQAQIVTHYFGDTSPGRSMAAFLSASDRLIESRLDTAKAHNSEENGS